LSLTQEAEAALGAVVSDVAPLSGGCVAQVYQLLLKDGRRIVAKAEDRADPRLEVEAYMLQYLASHSTLPVPQVLFVDESMLLLEYLQGSSHFGRGAQQHAAELLAELHGVSATEFGLEQDTLIGGLHQPNKPGESWIEFFAEQRLRYMAGEALRVGGLPESVWHRLARLCDQLDRWLLEPQKPSLIHGDVWTTNVLARGERITGFVDPAIYYAHAEVELAFTTLFGTFGEPFFERYHELRPIAPGFFEERKDLYNLYPLLVHVRLFGGSYVHSLVTTLTRFGF
jgi:fructosamine-3-kinase